MNTVTVGASKTYPIHIGHRLLPKLGAYLADAAIRPCKAVVIGDSNTLPLYGGTVCKSLEESGYSPVTYRFPAGETSKNLNTYQEILEFLAENRVTRSDILIALGGGVTGDMVGFAAATFLRGIRYVQVPTSLLAMVDSSVGGKTAVDLPSGKNLVGAFYQPSLVLCDVDTLATLPEATFRDGCAEVIKYGALYDPALFEHLEANGLAFDRQYVITRCVELKRDVVMEDEFDTGARQKLNLGHTVGHGIEACSNYGITHGCAVAIGMCIIAKASAEKGYCSPAVASRIRGVTVKFGLPTKTGFSAKQLADCALSDKKRFGGTINLIIPKAIGDCAITPTPVYELQSFIEAGL